jgi:hypothetical protein
VQKKADPVKEEKPLTINEEVTAKNSKIYADADREMKIVGESKLQRKARNEKEEKEAIEEAKKDQKEAAKKLEDKK